jgi:hypothetical protein
MDNIKKYELTYTYGVMHILRLHFFANATALLLLLVVLLLLLLLFENLIYGSETRCR